MQKGPPTVDIAAVVLRQAMGWTPVALRRFPTGAAHYVFEAESADGTSVVVRMGRPEQYEEMERGLRLAERLRRLGVPIPDVLAEGLDQPWPFVVMERLPGTDLGHVMRSLSDEQLRGVATRVAEAQRAASRFGSAGRYGYAPEADAAPHATWSTVLEAHIERSRSRIMSVRLFDPSIVEVAAGLFSAHRPALDALPAVPFLHDTTTKNVIVTEEGIVSGIVDIDDLCFGDPRYPAALTLAVLLAYGGPVGYVDAWMSIAGHHDDRIFRLYVALFLLDLMAEHGQTFNGNERPSTPEARDALKLACRRALEIASE